MKTPQLKSAFSVFAVFVIALALTLQAFFSPSVFATQITTRKLTLQAGSGGDGGSKPGGVVNHLFEFTVPTTGTAIGSIKFEYCTTAANSLANPTCVMPTDLDTTLAGATLGDELGVTGFTLNKTTNGAPYLSKATPSTPTGGGVLRYRLDGIKNPSTEGTFFVRISTYNSTDTSGSAIDTGTVTASTAKQIILNGTMPESLVFCTGGAILKPVGVPDCSTATSGAITFNQLFSPTDTASAISQMAASTNAGSGYVISVNGPTLTSGGNTIAPITAASGTASAKGIAQFGLNLTLNTATAAPGFDSGAPAGILTQSAAIDLASDGVNLNGRAYPGYDAQDTFKFDTSAGQNIVADSNYSVQSTGKASDAQIYTVSYIANVPGSQAAGTYTSTLTYICTPTF